MGRPISGSPALAVRRFDSAGGFRDHVLRTPPGRRSTTEYLTRRPNGGPIAVRFTRRRLLGVAAAGAASAAGVAVASSGTVAHQSSTTVGSGPTIRVDWTETYNGAVVDAGSDDDGPALSIGNAYPGDSGSLAFRVRPESDGDIQATFSLAVTANEEHGRNEPELAAGDDTPDTGELADAIETAVWYDTGAFGVDGLGGCDGDRDAAETVLVDGSLADAGAELDDGVRLGGDCIPSGDGVCVGISWSLPAPVGNRIQGDSVGTTLSFTTASCDGQ